MGGLGGFDEYVFPFFGRERSGVILTMMEGGWWAYLWRERESEREVEDIANIQNTLLIKKKIKNNKKKQLYLSNNAQQHPPSHPPTTPPTPPSKYFSN